MEAASVPAATAQAVSRFAISIEQIHEYEFRVRFDKDRYPELKLDEPAPLGGDSAPSPSRSIPAAASGDCLSARLPFRARKARLPIGPIHTAVRTELTRNERGRLRIASVEVDIGPNLSESERGRAQRCLGSFEDCVITQSVRDGIDVNVAGAA